MNRNEGFEDHQKFRELAALERTQSLSDDERLDLKRHLEVCASCQQAYDEYEVIGRDGMSFLAAAYGDCNEARKWDDGPARNKLLDRIRDGSEHGAAPRADLLHMRGPAFFPQRPMFQRPIFRNPIAAAGAFALAASALLLVAAGGYHLGTLRVVGSQGLASAKSSAQTSAQIRDVGSDKKIAEEMFASQQAQMSQLQIQASSAQQEIAKLRDTLRAAEAHSTALSAANAAGDEELRRATEQRDRLAVQLHDAEQSYQVVQAELTTLRAEYDRALLRTTSLESKIDEFTAAARDQQRRLKDDEQYLASDRDIRELMGARQLYIADVFDVDSSSRTRKPFGRVFYTESKSLIFYAFDLDHEPGVKNASAFQVWGRRDAESGEKHATNLGILYMDSDSNRRWVLRLDDPKQLAEIDAVFVTVEPHGGSQKPTGKPFLYALLRREANHP